MILFYSYALSLKSNFNIQKAQTPFLTKELLFYCIHFNVKQRNKQKATERIENDVLGLKFNARSLNMNSGGFSILLWRSRDRHNCLVNDLKGSPFKECF